MEAKVTDKVTGKVTGKVTDSVQETVHKSQEAVRRSPVGRLAEELPTDRLREEFQNLIGAVGARALNSMIDRVDETADRLVEYAEKGGGPGFMAALTGTSRPVTARAGPR
jgi:hypothetical protein